jgi:hypothetical protein
MFELHVGNTPCELTQKDYRYLAEHTEKSVIHPYVKFVLCVDIL